MMCIKLNAVVGNVRYPIFQVSHRSCASLSVRKLYLTSMAFLASSELASVQVSIFGQAVEQSIMKPMYQKRKE